MKLLFLLGLLTLLGSATQAATVIHTLSGSTATQNPSGTLVVPKFDTSLGPLQSVTLSLTVTTSGLTYQINLSNGTLNPTYGGYAFINDSTNVSFTGPGGLALTGNVAVGSVNQTWSNFSSSMTVNGSHDANSKDFTSVLTTGLSAFEGTGTFNIAWGLTNAHSHSTQSNTTTYTQITPNPNTIPFTTTYGPNSTFTGSLTFTYAPEPSRALLVLIGCAATLMRRRRSAVC